MPTIELTAKSLDEGRKLAAAKLNVAPETVELTVLEETKGLFGRAVLKLSATAPEAPAPEAARPTKFAPTEESAAEAPVAEKPKTTRGRSKKVEDEAPAEAEVIPPVAPAGPAVPPRRLGRKAPATEVAPPVTSPVAAPTPTATEESKPPGRRLGRTPVEAAAPNVEKPERTPRSEDANEEGLEATEEHAARFQAELEALLKTSGLSIEVTPKGVEGKYVNLQIGGEDAGHLIGRSGEVLNSLQYLTNLIGKQQHNEGIRVTLDANDYREKREEILREKTHSIALQVIENGMEALFPPMPAFERRVVHRIASEIEGIQTYSEGEEPNRQIVLAPAD